jgi:predicted amidohydrolase
MNWKQYQNELIALAAFVFMAGTYLYKNSQVNAQAQSASTTKQTVSELKEVVALKRVWSDRKITKKLKKLKELISASKVEWSKRSKKVTASYKGLTPNELNKLTTKILNLPIVIRKLDVKKIGASYDVEFKCKW